MELLTGAIAGLFGGLAGYFGAALLRKRRRGAESAERIEEKCEEDSPSPGALEEQWNNLMRFNGTEQRR